MKKARSAEGERAVEGVDQSRVDSCSSIAYAYAKSTFGAASPLGIEIRGEDGGFANIVEVLGLRIAVTSDGIGTKIEVAERVGTYDTLGFDLVAMVVDDLVAVGAEPFALSNIIDADRLDERVVDDLMRGLSAAARVCGVAVTGGEIAALGSRVSGFGPGTHVNWCATALGAIPQGREPISGREIRAGDPIVALRNVGLRSNGLTLARTALAMSLGDDWHRALCLGRPWGELLLTPSQIYAPGVVRLFRAGVRVRGVAHVTGGGISANLGRILVGRGLGAKLDQLFPPEPWVIELARLGGVSAREAYGQWNMGNGMLLVIAEQDVAPALRELERAGVTAQRAGTIVQGDSLSIDAQAWGLGTLRLPLD